MFQTEQHVNAQQNWQSFSFSLYAREQNSKAMFPTKSKPCFSSHRILYLIHFHTEYYQLLPHIGSALLTKDLRLISNDADLGLTSNDADM